MSVESAFQAAVYSALADDVSLMAAITAVYDIAPQQGDSGASSAFPYVTIGEVLIRVDDTNTETGFEITMRLHTWSRSASLKECKDIQGLIYDILHRGSLSIIGHYLVLMDRVSSDVQPDPNSTRHGVCEYRALVQKT